MERNRQAYLHQGYPWYHRCYLKRRYLTMHRPRRSRTSTSKFRPSFRVLIRQSLTRVIPTLMLPSGRQRHRIWLPDSLRTSLNTKATQLVRLWLLQVRRLNRPTLRKTRDFYPNIKKAVRSGFIPVGQPSPLYILQIFISVSHLCVSPP